MSDCIILNLLSVINTPVMLALVVCDYLRDIVIYPKFLLSTF